MEKESQSSTASATIPADDGAGTPEEEKDQFKVKLEGLPEKYKEEILKQYDLPDTKATLFSILKYATWVEIVLMVVGTLMSIGSGTSHKRPPTTFLLEGWGFIVRGRTAVDDGCIRRLDKRLWRNCIPWINIRRPRFQRRRFQQTSHQIGTRIRVYRHRGSRSFLSGNPVLDNQR